MFRPRNGRVLIKPDENTGETDFGLILTKEEDTPVTGMVVSDGEEVKMGDRVLFSKFGFDEVILDKELYYVVAEALILGVF